MQSSNDNSSSMYTDRLATFDGYWTGYAATAGQLAAIGHVSDRPPLESLEEGSRCVSCSQFVPKDTSIVTLEGSVNPEQFETLILPDFHRPGCIRLQIRLPFDTPNWFVDNALPSIKSQVKRFENGKGTRISRIAGHQDVPNRTSFLSLPIELRLQIYRDILPPLDSATEIVQIDRDSMRVTTAQALRRPRPHDPTQSAILRVCRATHHEVLDLIFSHTTFKFASSKLLYMFLRRIGKLGRSLLRNVDLSCGQREDAITFALLESCAGLRSITLRLPRLRIMPPGAPLWMHDGTACLLHLSGLEEVSFAPSSKVKGLNGSMPDGQLVRRELTRPRGAPGSIRSVHGILDI